MNMNVLDGQTAIETARKTILRRRAYCGAYLNVSSREALQPVLRNGALEAFNEAATDVERERFFTDAPAELAAAFIQSLDDVERIEALNALIALNPEAFLELLEGF